MRISWSDLQTLRERSVLLCVTNSSFCLSVPYGGGGVIKDVDDLYYTIRGASAAWYLYCRGMLQAIRPATL